VAEAGKLPGGHPVSCHERGHKKIDNVRLERTETAGRGHDGHVVLVGHQKEVAGLDGGEEALDLTAYFFHGAAHDIVGTGGRGGGGYEHGGRLRAQQLLNAARSLRWQFSGQPWRN